MKRTEAVLSRVALAATLGIAAGSAQAVPIIFDFSGTVEGTYHDVGGNVTYDGSLVGQAVTGRIIVETDGLRLNTRTGSTGSSIGYTDAIMDPAEQITSELIIGGVSYDVGLYSGNYGVVSAFDASGVPSCEGCSIEPDRISLQDISMEYWLRDGLGAPPPPPGEYSSRTLALSWYDATYSPDFIDLSNGFEPLDLIQWVTGVLPSGYYSENTGDCADGVCTGTASSQTYFRINSLSVHTPSVP